MSLVWLLLYLALTLAAGGAVVGACRLPLRLEERLAMVPVIGVIGGTAVTALISLASGLTVAGAVAGPAVVLVVGIAIGLVAVDPRTVWRASAAEAAQRWGARPPWVMLGLFAVAALALGALFAHGITESRDGLFAGYGPVWSDWAAHHTRAASFAVGGNFPPHDPLFSGTPLRYPFLAEFHSAMLDVLGLGLGIAFALPQVVICLCVVVLIVNLAIRLGAPARAGVIAAMICFLGGGLGFSGVFADACSHHGYAADRCTATHLVSSPVDGAGVIAGTLHDLPGLVAAQPRSYDGIDHSNQPVANLQWYTPLVAWWLPQIALGYGFAAALTVLLLVVLALREPDRQWVAFGIAGLLSGLLPLIHVHSLIALVIVLPFLAWRHRRREWFALAGLAAALALPRMIQLATGPHGAALTGNRFPTFEPGWMWNDPNSLRLDGVASSLPRLVGELAKVVVSPGFWEFWIANLGVAVPGCALLLAALACRWGPQSVARRARRVAGVFPRPMLEFCLPFMLIFAIANVVVVQSWDWDNTKLLAYWYLAVGLLAGTAASRWLALGNRGRGWWRRWWRPAAAALGVTTMVLSGVLAVLRLLPWTPSPYASSALITLATPDERRLADTVARVTNGSAVFVTPGRPHDPLLTLAGRTSVLGYYGWLWSYGTEFGSRPDDVKAIYRGCASEPAGCRVDELLHQYGVSYVEVDDRLHDTGVLESNTDLGWWAAQGLPVVAGSDHIVIYDVRHR